MRVDGLRICILELEDIASGRGDLMTWHVVASLMSDAIGNNADHLTPHTSTDSSMLEVNLAHVKVPNVGLSVKEGCALRRLSPSKDYTNTIR